MDVSDRGVCTEPGSGGEGRSPGEAVLRPGVCLRPHPGSRLPHPSPHVAGDVAGRRAAHGAMGAWAAYSWLTNAVPAEEAIPARLVIFCAMAAMFVASLAVPGTFGESGVLFGVASSWCSSYRWSFSPLPRTRAGRGPSSGSHRASWAALLCSLWPASSTASPRVLWAVALASSTAWRRCATSRASGSTRAFRPERHGLVVIAALGDR